MFALLPMHCVAGLNQITELLPSSPQAQYGYRHQILKQYFHFLEEHITYA
jgi:hypothetical protein